MQGIKSTVETPEPFKGNIAALGEIDFIVTGNQYSQTFKIWKDLMDSHHYLGAGPLFGRRIHYLVHSSSKGWIGGLSFSAAALFLEDRDRFIGWSVTDRKKNLHKLASNSRFLILPQLEIKNLASHLLSGCLKRLRSDWHEKYEDDLILAESFVEKDRFIGTSYQASNWHRLGSTKGRGRNDKSHAPVKPIKDIYVYPLMREWKEQLVSQTPEVQQEEVKTWIEEELHRVSFSNKLHIERLLSITADFYENPGASICQMTNGDRYAAKNVYRFFENPKTVDRRYEIIESHKKATADRIASEKVVLAVQDTTGLSYTGLKKTKGLGYLSGTGGGGLGLLLHDTVAFTPSGVPLGVLDAQVWARDEKDFGKKHRRAKLPIEAKESYKWLKSFKAVEAISKACPDTTIVSVGDREADIYELFRLAKRSKVELLVRATQNRVLYNEQKKLWDKMGEVAECGIQEVMVPPNKTYPKKRIASLSVRFGEVTLNPRETSAKPIKLWAVWATEENPPEGIHPLDWKLLTTMTVGGYKSACKMLRWYTQRWGIEVYHRTLKSGCNVEKQYFAKSERIELRLFIYMVIAWRIYYLTKMGREIPDVPCSIFFEEYEWKTLNFFLTEDRKNLPACRKQ